VLSIEVVLFANLYFGAIIRPFLHIFFLCRLIVACCGSSFIRAMTFSFFAYLLLELFIRDFYLSVYLVASPVFLFDGAFLFSFVWSYFTTFYTGHFCFSILLAFFFVNIVAPSCCTFIRALMFIASLGFFICIWSHVTYPFRCDFMVAASHLNYFVNPLCGAFLFILFVEILCCSIFHVILHTT